MKKWLLEHRLESVLFLAITLFVVIFGYYSFTKQAHFLTTLDDIGIMDQVVWNTAHGHIFQMTSPGGTQTISRFSIHADWTMILLSPIYWIYASPDTLMFAQILIVGLGAWPLFLLAKAVLKSRRWAFVVALTYLLNPLVERAAIYDFHSVTLATTFIIVAFYFLYQKRYGWYAVFALLTLSTKETASLSLIMIGLYAIIAQRNWKIGTATILISAGWFYALLWHIMPDVRGGGATNASAFLSYYSQFGNTPQQIIETVITKPQEWLKYIVTQHRLTYFLPLFIPTALLALLTPVILLAIPALMINMLSSSTNMTSIYFQYTSITSAFLFIAIVFGLKNILAWLSTFVKKYRFNISTRSLNALVLFFIVVCLGFSYWHWSLLPSAKHSDDYVLKSQTPAFASFVNNLSKTIPSSASVTTTLTLQPHFSERQHIYVYPSGLGLADYLIVRTDDPQQAISQRTLQLAVSQTYDGQKYRLISESGPILVYQKFLD